MQTPEPDIVSSSKTDASLLELEDHLDDLWESYLELLDQYTKAQSAFSAVLEDPKTSDEPDETGCDYTKSPIADAVNAARGLRDIETEIRKTRKAVKKAEKASGVAAH